MIIFRDLGIYSEQKKTKKIERIQHFLRKKNDDIILIDVTDKFINDDATLKASHGVT